MTRNSGAAVTVDSQSDSAVAERNSNLRRIRPVSQRSNERDRSETVLDPTMQSPEVEQFEMDLRGRVVGQDRAIRQLARVYQVYLSGLSAPGRPLANLLLLGPTGSGKTRLVEATAEALFGTPKAVLKIDCAEFQHSHEIAKLIGSPPGYLGHRETQPLITQERLEQHYTEKTRLSLVLFDEIEKASDAVWQLLLGILDKATLTLGDNRSVDFSQAMIFLTSNLGSTEIGKLISGRLGFTCGPRETAEDLDQKIYKVAQEAARRKFSREFMNRIDKVIVFRALGPGHLEEVLDIELARVQERIVCANSEHLFVFKCTPGAREFLLREGTDAEFGARHLKRSIERHLVFPLSSVLATGQIELGDVVTIDFDPEASKLVFGKDKGAALADSETRRNWETEWAESGLPWPLPVFAAARVA
jgi:ATP-dependent Clp protease ATP-binding subunit ClpB